jgi:hypothetical protein
VKNVPVVIDCAKNVRAPEESNVLLGFAQPSPLS